MCGITDREEPVGVLAVVQLIVEIPGASSHKLASLSEGQSPADGPVSHSANKGVQGVLQQNVDSILRPDIRVVFCLNHHSNSFISYLTDPASRKAKPACMKKIKRDTIIKKN